MKRGISLIAVLMFMLAATTASIVVFRMIGSENFSSGSRLKASEAYQASESGIDYVRSWMENKAADVSALVTQYYKPAKPKPLKIFSDIRVGDKSQTFSAYLIGIDTLSKPVLKLKIFVEGKARDESKVSQTAIFSTDGLYKIYIPAETKRQKTSTELNPYHGGSMKYHGTKKISGATINGNWTGNPPITSGNFIVTGNFQNSGSSVDIEGNTCIGGNFAPDNNFVKIGGGLYMGSSTIGVTTSDGSSSYTSRGFIGNEDSYQDVYCDGDIEFGTSGATTLGINGNLTINGKMSGFNGNRRYRVGGNLVLGDTDPSTANIDFNYGWQTANGSLVVCGDVWTTNEAGVKASESQGRNIKFNYANEEGCKDKSVKLYFKNAIRTGNSNEPREYRTQPDPSVGYFRSKETINNLPSYQNKPEGASSIKEFCMGTLGEKRQGCDGSKYLVDDPIATSLGDIKKFLNDSAGRSTDMYNSFKCLSKEEITVTSVGVISKQGSTTLGSAYKLPTVLNDCYNKLKNKPTLLYGGKDGYLIVKLYQDQDYSFIDALNGKFIFIYERAVNRLFITPTTKTSRVMMFLEKGVPPTGEMKSGGCQSDPAGGYYKYPYFIYSMEEIYTTTNWSEQCPLEGNIFFPSSNCNARLINANNEFSLIANTELVDELMDMGIICKRKGGNTGNCTEEEIRETKEGDSEEAEIINHEILDNHWIPIATRLPIKLESKEISKEKINTNDIVPSSILIMPRVIYLTSSQINSESELSKYYAPLYLNGAIKTDEISPNSITCGMTDFVTKKRYTCSFQGRTDISNFYVIIDPDSDVTPPSVIADCSWPGGMNETKYSGQNKPQDPTIICSSGTPRVQSWSWLSGNPPNPLVRGTFTPIPNGVTCDGIPPTNAGGISCGTLTVKTKPEIESCVGDINDSEPLPNVPRQPTITLNDPDNICSDDSRTPNKDWIDVNWTVNRVGVGLVGPDIIWDMLFNYNGTISYDDYKVSGKCGEYGTLQHDCIGNATVSGTHIVPNECSYKPEWCNGMSASEVTTAVPNSGGSSPNQRCVFLSSITGVFNITNAKINGVNCNYMDHSNNNYCGFGDNNNFNLAKQDGGYYVYIPASSHISNLTATAGTALSCGSGDIQCTTLHSNGGIYTASGPVNINDCFSFSCTGELQAGYVGTSQKYITVSDCGSTNYVINPNSNGNNINYEYVCRTEGDFNVTAKSAFGSGAYISFKCIQSSGPTAGPCKENGKDTYCKWGGNCSQIHSLYGSIGNPGSETCVAPNCTCPDLIQNCRNYGDDRTVYYNATCTNNDPWCRITGCYNKNQPVPPPTYGCTSGQNDGNNPKFRYTAAEDGDLSSTLPSGWNNNTPTSHTFSTGNDEILRRNVYMYQISCGGNTINLGTSGTTKEGKVHCDGYIDISPNCGQLNSSSSAQSSTTLTCSLQKTNVTLGENIPAPTLSCSSGNPTNKNFTASGGGINNIQNWSNNTSAHYSSRPSNGTSEITVNAQCGNTSFNNITCGTITVNNPTCSGVSGNATINQTITPTVGCGNVQKSGNPTFNDGGVGGGGWNSNNNGGGWFNSVGNKTLYLASVTCDNNYLNINGTDVPCGSVTVASSPTITCTFAQSSYAINTNISPQISCSGGGFPDMSGANFNISGVSPYDANSWKNQGGSTQYGSSGTSTVKINGAKCGGINVSETTCTPTLTITSGTTYTLTCTGLPSTGTAGTAITQPTVQCNGQNESNISWTNAPTWNNPTANTYNVSVKANSGNCNNQTVSCGTLVVNAAGGGGNTINLATVNQASFGAGTYTITGGKNTCMIQCVTNGCSISGAISATPSTSSSIQVSVGSGSSVTITGTIKINQCW